MTMTPNPDNKTELDVPFFHAFFGGLVAKTTSIQKVLGEMESAGLGKKINSIKIEKPIFITSLARSGTTIILEIINSHPQITTHKYQDYPFLFTPYIWNKFLGFVQKKTFEPQERSHLDGIKVTPESPEAFEEMLWMSFFPNIHNVEKSNVLGAETQSEEFEKFYSDHIKKLLLVRKRSRYATKANYNISRIEYIAKIFPDARFIIPIRDPVSYIASTMKQHRLFSEGEKKSPRMLSYLSHVGHFEFGQDRRVINFGNNKAVDEINSAWQNGEEIKGWAKYWNYFFGYLHELLERNPGIAEKVKVIKYEELCNVPKQTIGELLDFCGLDDTQFDYQRFVSTINTPTYYTHDFSEQDIALIKTLTSSSKALFNYQV